MQACMQFHVFQDIMNQHCISKYLYLCILYTFLHIQSFLIHKSLNKAISRVASYRNNDIKITITACKNKKNCFINNCAKCI